MQIRFVTPNTREWETASALAKNRYYASFGATIQPHPDSFVICASGEAGSDGSSEVLAVAGFTFAERREVLFSERYLDEPVERLLSRLDRRIVRRDAIVEVGSLAAMRGDAGLELVKLLPILAWCRGREYVLCTVTQQLKRLLEGVGLTFNALRAADPERIGPDARSQWGEYYQTEPVTGYVKLDRIAGLFSANTGRYNFANCEVEFREFQEVQRAAR